MNSYITRPRKATHNVTVKAAAIVSGFKFGDGNVAYMQFPTRLPDTTTLVSATLRLRLPDGVVASAGTTVTLAAVEYATDGMDASVAAAVAHSASAIAWPTATADGYHEFDVATLLDTAFGFAGWNGMLTLSVSMTNPATGQTLTLRSISDQWLEAPQLVIASDWTESEDSPYLLVMRALWALLESHPSFAALVSPGNRIKFDTDDTRAPEKDVPSDADMPEVSIVMTGGAPHARRTSSTSFDAAKFTVMIASGDQRSGIYYAVRWAIFRALANWSTALPFVKWNSKAFAVQPVQGAVTESLDANELNRGTTGWTAVWECELQVSVDTADL